MIQSTTMGYLAGGPSGAVVGAAQGVMTTIADYWIKKAEELKNTLDSIKATDAFIAEFERLRELLKQLKTSSLDELYDLEQEYTRKAADQYITMKELGKTADTKEGAEQYDQAAKEYTKTMQELDRITGRISQLEDE